MIREALKFLRAAIPATIEMSYEPRSERDTVVADQTQMLQVLMNLSANAAHAMRGRGGRIGITLEEAAPGEPLPFAPAPERAYLKIAVQDSGEGIAPEILDQVMEPSDVRLENCVGDRE
jgi:two-component system cell cycle sensor histidine kinase/response regulator CckA